MGTRETKVLRVQPDNQCPGNDLRTLHDRLTGADHLDHDLTVLQDVEELQSRHPRRWNHTAEKHDHAFNDASM